MGRIVLTEFISVDGVVEAPGGEDFKYPDWSFAFDRGPEAERFKELEALGSAALLLGRTTYEGFAQAWPGRTDEQGYAERMNGMPKHVVSSTLQAAEWNNTTIVCGNLAEEVGRLKEQPGQDILVFGSGVLVNGLLARGLVDRFTLLIYPLALGSGQRLFADGSAAKLTLVESKAFGSGVVACVYDVAKG